MTDTIVFKRIGLYSKPNFLDKRLTTDSFYQRSWSIVYIYIYIYSGALEIYYVFVSKSYTKF